MKSSSLSTQMFYRLQLTVVLLFISSLLKAQTTIQTEFISIKDGLTSANVQDVFQDSYGLMWVATDNGLHQYDGYKFTRYKNIPGKSNSLLNDNIWTVVEDSNKNIWVGTEDGVASFNRRDNEFTNYDFVEIFKTTPNSGGRVFNLFLDSKNRIWAATVSLEVLLFDSKSSEWKQVPNIVDDTNNVSITGGFALAITEDKEGTIWAGSKDKGLVYFNDADTVFMKAKFNSGDIDFTKSENTITALYADLTNTLWITTRNGIYKYNMTSGELRTIKEYNYGTTIVWNHWNSFVKDFLGNVWITNNVRGMLKFDGISDEYEEVYVAGRNRNKDGSSDIVLTDCTIDKTGIIWFGSTINGIMKYDSSKEPFMHYAYDETDKKSISSNQIFGLLESKVHKGKVFVGTRGGGLNIFDQNEKTFSTIQYKSVNDMFGGSVRSIYEDDDGSLWLGTWGDGVVHLNSNYKEIKRFVNDSLSFNSLSDNSVRVIKKDNNGNYWFGTNNGLNFFDTKTNTLKRIGSLATRVYPQQLYDITSKFVKNKKVKAGIVEVGNFEDLSKEFEVIKPRKYLIVTGGEGFFDDSLMYDYGWIENTKGDSIWGSNDVIKTYHLSGALKNRINFDIIELKPGRYNLRYKSDDSHSYGDWNATAPKYEELWGINVIELENDSQVAEINKFLNEKKSENKIDGNNIRSIHVSGNIVWIGTDAAGLNKLNLENNNVIVYSYDEKNDNSLSNNSVQYIYEDPDGILWLATNAGLNKFDPSTETSTVFTEDNGLPTNYIASILPGNGTELWIATRNGISKMVTDNESGQVTFVNYDTEDGLGGMDFIALVAEKTSNGEFYFGGEHGLNVFTPGESNSAEPNLIFSDLKISNKSLKSYDQDNTPLETSLIDLEKLELSHDQNDLTFTFAALHYSKPNKNQYAHKLIGYDKDWIFNNKREVTYTNLDPGEYTFSIKGSNRDGVWRSTPKSIAITINPPWWFTTWAYIGYGLLLLAGIFAVDRIQRRRLMHKARERMKIQNAEHRAEAAELQAKAAESERRALEVEFQHKKKELDEARDLQLSMLPKELPQLPHLDIAVYMRTATEVGGDYYDFHIGLDGTLTVVLGDATGHGMKAGTMVTTTKSLFNVLAPNPNIINTFHEMTRCLKLMHMEKLSMCMTMLKITGNTVQMSAAGMPPVFIYKRENQSIEEHVMKGMPLGTFRNFPYSLIKSELSAGDTILLMSDGFPELFNDKKEMYGYKRARNLFEELATEAPEEIISKLKTAGSDWVNDNDPDDDVTFVVIKVK